MPAKSKTDQWLDNIVKDHGTVQSTVTGIEIVGRIIIRDEGDYAYVEEILEKIREIGAAEITQQIQL